MTVKPRIRAEGSARDKFYDQFQPGIWARVLADSVPGTDYDHRLTTLELSIPKPYLAELNTHGRTNRNTASARAISTDRMIEIVERQPYFPAELGREKKGMSPGDLIELEDYRACQDDDNKLRAQAVEVARRWQARGVHKSKINRLLERWMFVTVVITATEWENFINLRTDEAADIEMQRAAACVERALHMHDPTELQKGEWHLPYVDHVEAETIRDEGYDPVAISVTRCGRVSTLWTGGERTYEQDTKWHDNAMTGAHWSCFQHQAQYLPGTVEGRDTGNLLGPWFMYRKMQPGEAVFRKDITR